jgi:D-sedoheptulose 7-phosphate isomerase
MKYSKQHIEESIKILELINTEDIESMANIISRTKNKGGRLFFLGVGGGAGNASHAVNDFRKICGIESYAPTDNVSELTARTNDEGWETVFIEWLKCSHVNDIDCIFVFSVGGGDKEKNVSANLVYALEYAKSQGSKIVGVVGRNGGYTKKVADACCVIPTVNDLTITPHTEGFQAVIWHVLVSHPLLKVKETKWESVS